MVACAPMASKKLLVQSPTSVARHEDGVVLEGVLVPWAEIRAVGTLTCTPWPGVDPDCVVIQTRAGRHHWIEGMGWSELAEWNTRNWNDETVARLTSWWVQTLSGLPEPPTTLPFGNVAILGEVQWPPQDRGRPMYAERARRLFGLLPWNDELVALLA